MLMFFKKSIAKKKQVSKTKKRAHREEKFQINQSFVNVYTVIIFKKYYTQKTINLP